MCFLKQYLKKIMIQLMGYRRVYSLINLKNLLGNRLVLSKNRLLLALYKATSFSRGNRIFLLAQEISPRQIIEIKSRLDFYLPRLKNRFDLIIQTKPSLKMMWSAQPVLLFGSANVLPDWMEAIRPGTFDVDYRHNPKDGWHWCELADFCSPKKDDYYIVRERFRKYIDSLHACGFQKTYIFGTGPSLENAFERDWSDGYRIVCNTIVRDPKLWKHINPHFIAAGDAIYHFGHTAFARAFRRDLAHRLEETSTYFIYPETFHEIVSREFSNFANRLIPVPSSSYRLIHYDMYKKFVLSGAGNVLVLLLLPLACTLSKRVYLWGFDGRAPNDKLFWSNSSLHSYPEFIPELQQSHPAFFNHFVPSDNPAKYVNQVHGDILDDMLIAAEKDGWSFMMLHKSWTPTLQKRFHETTENLYV